jgi:hypothetical protein
MNVISPFKWQTTALTVVGPGLLQGTCRYTSVYPIFWHVTSALQKLQGFFVLCHLEVIVEEKRKRITAGTTPEERRKIWADIIAQFSGEVDDWRDEGRKILEADRQKLFEAIQEAINNAPPGSFGELLDLIAIVQDKAPEAGEALFQLLERHFQRRRVLYITSERLRLEGMWKLELSLNEWGELKPHSYEDEAPLALVETINQCGDYLLGELRQRMRNTMRNHLIRGGAQGRNIDIVEVEREYRLKEFGDDDNPHEIFPNYSKWDPKEKMFKGPFKYRNPEYDLQYTTEASPAFRADPWHPWEVIDIPEEDKPLWEIITKSLPVLDDVNKAIIIGIMYDIPITKISKATGIPEGTLRSRKSRLLAEARKNATLLQILQRNSIDHPYHNRR